MNHFIRSASIASNSIRILLLLPFLLISACDYSEQAVDQKIDKVKHGAKRISNKAKELADELGVDETYKDIKRDVKQAFSREHDDETKNEQTGSEVAESKGQDLSETVNKKVDSFIETVKEKHGEVLANCLLQHIYKEKQNFSDKLVCAAAFKQAGIEIESETESQVSTQESTLKLHHTPKTKMRLRGLR